MMRAFTLVLLAGTVLLSACNTIEGAGKDVSSVGRTVARTADGAK
jgi:predicted small secreted protein